MVVVLDECRGGAEQLRRERCRQTSASVGCPLDAEKVTGRLMSGQSARGWKVASDPRRLSRALGSDAATNLCHPVCLQPADSTREVVGQVQTLLAVAVPRPSGARRTEGSCCLSWLALTDTKYHGIRVNVDRLALTGCIPTTMFNALQSGCQ